MATDNRKIKIAHVITRLDWGGSPDIVRVLCAGLDPARYDVTLVSGPSAHLSRKTREFLRTFGGRFVEVPHLVRDIDPLRDARAFGALYRLFREKRFDVVHTHTAKAGAIGRVAARCAGCRAVVHTPHGHNFYGYFGPGMSRCIVAAERFFSTFCDTLIALTDLEKRDMVAYHIAPADKIEIVYQGLELSDFTAAAETGSIVRESLGIQPGRFLVGMIGRLEPVKGPDIFIEAAGIAADAVPAADFILVGEGSMRAALESRAAALGLKKRCVFTGWRDDVARILSALDLFVLPSRNEAVGMALVEAQAAGIPVVASRVGGIPEVVQDTVTGSIVPPDNPPALAGMMIALLADPAKRQAMGEAGKAFVAGKFRAEAMIAHMDRIYRKRELAQK